MTRHVGTRAVPLVATSSRVLVRGQLERGRHATAILRDLERGWAQEHALLGYAKGADERGADALCARIGEPPQRLVVHRRARDEAVLDLAPRCGSNGLGALHRRHLGRFTPATRGTDAAQLAARALGTRQRGREAVRRAHVLHVELREQSLAL